MSVKVVIVSVSFKAFWVFGLIFIGILNEMENLDNTSLNLHFRK